MRLTNRAKRALCHAHNQWNGFVFTEPASGLLSLVRSKLKSHQVVIDDSEILVTEIGFVTMAVHADRAVKYGESLVVPGVDSNGVCGFLVLREGAVPYHSLSSNVNAAYHESDRAHGKASALVAAYGDKDKLKAAAHKAPWYRIITEQDVVCSGLCLWGSESFLRRIGLLFFAKRFGLPRLILRLAGSYGDRVAAASMLRTKLD